MNLQFLKHKLNINKPVAKVSVNAKSGDINSYIKDYKLRLQKLAIELQESDDAIKDLNHLLFDITSAPRTKVNPTKKSVLSIINEKISIYDKVSNELNMAQKYYTQIKSVFGDNPAAKPLLLETTRLIKLSETNKNKVTLAINKLADNNGPAILDSEENTQLGVLEELIDAELDKLIAAKKLRKDRSRKSPDWGDIYEFRLSPYKKGIRFAKFIEVINIPKLDNTILDKGYFVVYTDIDNPTDTKGKIAGDYNDVILTFTTQVTEPSKLTGGYPVTSKKATENALSWLATKNNLDWCKFLIKVDPKLKLDILKKENKLYILDKPGVKFKNEDNLLKILVPKSVMGISDEESVDDVDKKIFGDLFIDVKRLIGLAAGYTNDLTAGQRMKLKKAFDKGTNLIYEFTILPKEPDIVKDDEFYEDSPYNDTDVVDQINNEFERGWK